MDWKKDKIIKRIDNSYVIQHEGVSRVVPFNPSGKNEIWHEINKVARANKNSVVYERDIPQEKDARLLKIGLLKMELGAIDTASARPIRAMLTDTASEEDLDILVRMEHRARAIRAELSELNSNVEERGYGFSI